MVSRRDVNPDASRSGTAGNRSVPAKTASARATSQTARSSKPVSPRRDAVLVHRDGAEREAGLSTLRALGLNVVGASDIYGARVAVTLDGARLVLVDRTLGGASTVRLLRELERSFKGGVQAMTALVGLRSEAEIAEAEREAAAQAADERTAPEAAGGRLSAGSHATGNGRYEASGLTGAPKSATRPGSGIGYPAGEAGGTTNRIGGRLGDLAPASRGAESVVPEASVLDLPLREAREQFERMYMDEQLRRSRGNVSAVARTAGLARTFLHAKLAKLDLDPADYRRRKRRRKR